MAMNDVIVASSGLAYRVHDSIEQNAREGLVADGNFQVVGFALTTMNRDYMFYVRDGANCWGLTVSQEHTAPLCECQPRDPLRDHLPCKVRKPHLFS